MLWLVLAIVFAWACYSMAKNKGRDATGWCILGLLFGFIPLIILAVLPDVSRRSDQ